MVPTLEAPVWESRRPPSILVFTEKIKGIFREEEESRMATSFPSANKHFPPFSPTSLSVRSLERPSSLPLECIPRAALRLFYSGVALSGPLLLFLLLSFITPDVSKALRPLLRCSNHVIYIGLLLPSPSRLVRFLLLFFITP